jgi:hypothetical protein
MASYILPFGNIWVFLIEFALFITDREKIGGGGSGFPPSRE